MIFSQSKKACFLFFLWFFPKNKIKNTKLPYDQRKRQAKRFSLFAFGRLASEEEKKRLERQVCEQTEALKRKQQEFLRLKAQGGWVG